MNKKSINQPYLDLHDIIIAIVTLKKSGLIVILVQSHLARGSVTNSAFVKKHGINLTVSLQIKQTKTPQNLCY